MASDGDKSKRPSTEATEPGLEPTAVSDSTLAEEKSKPKAEVTADVGDATDTNDATKAEDATTPEYPQGWRLWTVYVATLLTMFLVPLDMVRQQHGDAAGFGVTCSAHRETGIDHRRDRDPQDHAGVPQSRSRRLVWLGLLPHPGRLPVALGQGLQVLSGQDRVRGIGLRV